MDYGYGKTYVVPGKFTALNGAIQYFTVEANVSLEGEDAIAQANLLRVLEVLRTFGGQPVITKVEGAKVHFTLEQANVYGKGGLHAEIHGENQVSAKAAYGFEKAAKEKIESLFANVKDVENKGALLKSVEVKEAF